MVIPKIFGGSSGDVPKELFYLKDDALYGVSLKNSKQEPVEYTDELGSGATSVLDMTPQISKNGKYRFFIEDAEYDSNTGDVVMICTTRRARTIRSGSRALWKGPIV